MLFGGKNTGTKLILIASILIALMLGPNLLTLLGHRRQKLL